MDKISKEQFCKYIKAIQAQMEHDSKCGEAFRIILPNDHISLYDTTIVTCALIELLIDLTNDNKEDSWIEYYIYELDFGKEYKEGSIKKDGISVPLRNEVDLYKILSE